MRFGAAFAAVGASALLTGAAALPGPRLLDPVHVFSLADAGLETFFEKEEIASSFENLVADRMSVDANGNCMALQRQRRYAAYEVHIASAASADQTNVTVRDGPQEFKQEVSDFRNQTRVFEPLEPHVRDSEFLKGLIRLTTSWAAAAKFGAHSTHVRANVSVHQVRQIVIPGRSSDNAPEGVHRDGADFIVSALVLNRRNVVGGKSTVYSPDMQSVLLEHTLAAGEGIFHEDRDLWHDVTKIAAAGEEEPYGYRDIIGLDIILTKDGLGFGRGCAE